MRVAIFFSAIILFVLAVAALPMSGPAEAVTKSGEPTVIRSVRDMEGTVAALEASLRRRGVARVVTMDHSVAHGMAATLVLFANPLQSGQEAAERPLDAIDLPLRALVYTQDGNVSVTFDNPKALSTRYGMTAAEAGAASRAIAAVVGEAAGS